MAVVDVYDALRTARPYKPPLPLDKALDIMRAETDAGALEPRVFAAFPQTLRDGEGRAGRRIVPRA